MKKFRGISRFIILIILLALNLPCVTLAATQSYEVNLLPETYQKITGWGAFPASVQDLWLDKYAAHTAIYRELGINSVRIELRGNCGDGEGNLVKAYMDTFAGHIKTAVNNNIKDYMVCIWTPPAEMKTNNKIEGQNDDGTRATLLVEKEQTFCHYIVNVLGDLEKRGLPLPQVLSMQNEPNNAFSYYQCCYYDMEQFKRVFKLMRKTLDASGYEDILLAGAESPDYKDNHLWFGESFEELETDEEFRKAMGVFTTHSYYAPAVTNQKRIDKFIDNKNKIPEKEVWQTEYSTAHNQAFEAEIDRVIGGVGVFITDVAWVGVNRWYWWMGWDPRYPITEAHQEVLLAGDGITGVTKSLMYQVFEKVWNNAPAGAKVMRLSTNDPAVVNTTMPQSDMVAFSADGRNTVLFINSSDEDKTYSFNGLTGSSVEVYTAAKDSLDLVENRNLAGGSLENVLIPARSVNVIVTRANDEAAPKITYEKEKSVGIDGDTYISREKELPITIRLDEPATLIVNKQKVTLGDDLSYQMNLKLDGIGKTVRIDAKDEAGNQSEPLFLKFRYDEKYVAVVLDTAEERTNSSTYELRGSVNVESDLTVNGESVPLDDELNFTYQMALQQGENPIRLLAVDKNGNKSPEKLHTVWCDSAAPEISLDNTEFTTTDAEYVLSGKVSEPVKAFKINQKPVTVKDDLTFRMKVYLKEGENQLTLQATDLFENHSEKTITLNFEKTSETPYLTDSVSYTRKADRRIAVDGNLEEAWVIDNKANKVVNGVPCNIMNFGTLWDEDYLYVGARVYDSSLIFDDDRVYQNDCVEIFLNPTNSKTGAYGEGDCQLFIGYPKGRPALFVNEGADCLVGWKDFEGGYTVEMAIPWKSMGISPKDGVRIGFDITNDDKNVEGGAREAVMTWAGTGDNWQTTANFGTLILTASREVTYQEKQQETISDIPAASFAEGEDSENWLERILKVLGVLAVHEK